MAQYTRSSLDTKMAYTRDFNKQELPVGTVIACGRFVKVNPSPKFPNQCLMIIQDPARGTLQIPMTGAIKRIFAGVTPDPVTYKEYVGRLFEVVYKGMSITKSGAFAGQPCKIFDVNELVLATEENAPVGQIDIVDSGEL